MNRLFTYLAIVILLSCSKEHSCENCGSATTVPVPTPAGNKPPVAIAFYDSLNNQPAGSELVTAKYSTDPDGTIVSYQWKSIGGPGTATIIAPTNYETVISNLITGVYLFELTVTDNGGLSAKDTVTIAVTIPVSSATVIANAGPDQTITLPLDSTYLDGSRSKPNGAIASTNTTFIWNCIKGPRQYVLNLFGLPGGLDRTTVSTNGLRPGTYWFELRVTVPGVASDVDTVVITVVDDPRLKNTVTYHDLAWTEGDPAARGQLTTFIATAVKPDLFTPTATVKPIEISLRPDAASSFVVIPFKSNTPFTWDAALYNAWIMTVPNNRSLLGKTSDLRVRFL